LEVALQIVDYKILANNFTLTLIIGIAE